MRIYDHRGENRGRLLALGLDRARISLNADGGNVWLGAIDLDAAGLRALAEACTYMAGAIDPATTVGDPAPDTGASVDDTGTQDRLTGDELRAVAETTAAEAAAERDQLTADPRPQPGPVRVSFYVYRLGATRALDWPAHNADTYEAAADWIARYGETATYRIEKVYRRIYVAPEGER